MVGSLAVSGRRIDFGMFNGSTGAFDSLGACGTNVHPRIRRFFNYEMTWNSSGVATTGAWKPKGTINSYDANGNPASLTQENWPAETYVWDNSGLIKKRTYQNFSWYYRYYPATRLLQGITQQDGQRDSFIYDKFQRLTTAWTRGGNVVTGYVYQFKNASNPNNYIQATTTYATVSADSKLAQRQTFQYFDGLGRLLQAVAKQQSPAQKDVVRAVKYDAQGRQTHVYEPFEATTTTGAYASAIPAATAFTLTTYETSPLSRVSTVTPPKWYATTYTYGANAASEVLLSFSPSTYYAAGLLRKTTVQDGQGNKAITFTDKLGRTVLSRRTNSAEASGSRADTYTLYDDKSRIKNVIPPGATPSLVNLIFTYRYDGADNLIFKKVPGAADVNM